MKNLLYKEWRLAMHPTIPLFWGLSLMLFIPNYPYEVIFFYTALSLFFLCLSGRENSDIEYTLTLPVAKKDAVRARILFAVLTESVQLSLMLLIGFLRQALGMGANQAGMDVNLSLFAFGLALLGVFNHAFFTRYYRQPLKVGRAFAISSLWIFLLIALQEAAVFLLPFWRTKLDTPDPLFLPEKLLMLALGLFGFLLLTLRGMKKAEKSFEALDL